MTRRKKCIKCLHIKQLTDIDEATMQELHTIFVGASGDALWLEIWWRNSMKTWLGWRKL